MRFYLDENLSHQIALRARRLGLDVVSTHETGTNGLSDAQQLTIAAQQERVLFTRDRADYIHLTVDFLRDGRPHAGVLLVSESLPGDQFDTIARALYSYAEGHNDWPMAYLVDFL